MPLMADWKPLTRKAQPPMRTRTICSTTVPESMPHLHSNKLMAAMQQKSPQQEQAFL